MTCPICLGIIANVYETFKGNETIQMLADNVLVYHPTYDEASAPFVIDDLLFAALPVLSGGSEEEQTLFCQYVMGVCT